jgi:hypothetical protein
MRQLLYVSDTAPSLPDGTLDAILTASRTHNAPAGITGLLLHIEGGFLQVLEGEETAVRALYDKIARDPRHWNCQVLLDQEAPRAFGDWSMGFERPSAEDPQTAGMFAVTREALMRRISPEAGKVVIIMLETFYRVQKNERLGLTQSA